jgi:hypothetical protein
MRPSNPGGCLSGGGSVSPSALPIACVMMAAS